MFNFAITPQFILTVITLIVNIAGFIKIIKNDLSHLERDVKSIKSEVEELKKTVYDLHGRFEELKK